MVDDNTFGGIAERKPTRVGSRCLRSSGVSHQVQGGGSSKLNSMHPNFFDQKAEELPSRLPPRIIPWMKAAQKRRHSPEDPWDCTFPDGDDICGKKYTNKWHDLARHLTSVHERQEGQSCCEICGLSLSRDDSLGRHKMIIHKLGQ